MGRVAEIQGWVAQYRFLALSASGHGRRPEELLQENRNAQNKLKSEMKEGIELGDMEKEIRDEENNKRDKNIIINYCFF